MKTMHVMRIVLLSMTLTPLVVTAAAAEQGNVPRPPSQAQATASAPDVMRGNPAGVVRGPVNQTPGADTARDVTADIRDVRGPREIPNPWMWSIYAAAAILGLLLLYAVWRIVGRRKSRVQSAHERAFEALARARELMQPENAREFSFQVSGAVRVYIEERFSVRSTQQTTGEFLNCLAENDAGPLAAQRILLAEFLKNCDLVKFARFGLTREEMEAMFRSAWQFVDATKPEVEESPKAGSRFRVPGIRGRAARTNAEQRTSNPGSNLMVGGVS